MSKELEELKAWIRENLTTQKGSYEGGKISRDGTWIKKRRQDIYDKIVEFTNFLDNAYDNVSLRQRLWHLDNDKFEVQYCKWCRKVVPFKKQKYKVYCSDKCKYAKISNDRKGMGNPAYKHGLKNKGLVFFDTCTHLNELDKYTDYRKCLEDQALEVRCQWCGEWYKISYNDYYKFFNRNNDDPNFFLHCSEQCKKDNPLFSRNGKFGKDAITYFRGKWKWAWYDTYSAQLQWAEETRKEQETGALLVKCYHCREWFRPTQMQVFTRLNGINNGTCNFYCSDECKYSCPNYKARKYYKHNRPWETNHNNEVHPELRKLVFERDNYECQICGETNHIQCHHIDPIVNNPIESADMDNCITLCSKHHKQVHKLPGCSTGYLSANCNLI